MLRLDIAQSLLELGIDEEHRGAGMFDDVSHFLGVETKVDRHEDPTRTTDPEQREQESSRVVGDDGHPFARTDVQSVKGGRLRPGQFVHPSVRQLTQ